MFLFGPSSKFNTKFSGTADANASATTETSILPTGEGSLILPAFWMRQGSTARLILRGICSTPLVAGTATFRLKLNGTTIATGAISALLGSQTGVGFSLAETITIRTTGASGTAVVAGSVKYPNGALQSKGETDMNNTFNIDTTIDQTVSLTAQFSLASHSITIRTCTLELLEL